MKLSWAVLGWSISSLVAADPTSTPPKTLPAMFRWPPGVQASDRLALHDAIAVALWNNTQLEADLTAVGIAKADLFDAGLRRNPNLWSLLPTPGKPFEILLNWPIDEFWQRPRRVKAAQANLDALATSLEVNGLTLARDVAVAHADSWLAQQRAATLTEAAALRERVAAMTEKRRAAGDASGLDVALAVADARSAREAAVRAAGDVPIAGERLRGLLGMRGELAAAQASLDPLPAAAEAGSVEAAFAARPDLRGAALSIEAATLRARWQRSRVVTLLNAILSVKPVGSPFRTRAAPGVQGDLPIFNRNQGQIARADAEVEQASWRYAATRDRIEQEVREAKARLAQASRAVEELQLRVRPAVEKAITQATAAYQNGDASLLSVLEATRQRYDMALREMDAEATWRRARAEVDRAVGKKQ